MMEVYLMSYTEHADRLCNNIAHTCTSSLSGSDAQELWNLKNILPGVINSGHMSVVEHATFTFSISGVSRVLTHQLVRHRMASYTQQSQRYVPTEGEWVIPPTLADNQDYCEIMNTIFSAYEDLCKVVDKEDARYILPGGMCTNIVVTMNARELLHFFSLRCCERAQWEIRDMANLMLAECKKVSPVIFAKAGAPCVYGKCPEGKRTCGNPKGGKV